MPKTVDVVRAPFAAALREVNGTSGRPKFLGLYRDKANRDLALWSDGSRAVMHEDDTFTALEPVSYDALFVTTVATADDALSDRFGLSMQGGKEFCANNRCLALHPADTVTCPDCGESFR